MRTAFINTLVDLAEEDERIFLLVGDLGYSVVEQFKVLYPERYYNMGVAEQNMMGVAAGLALSNKVVFTYSFGTFTTFRCLEQIRNDICYHNLNVKIIGIGTGFAYGTLGMTHHATEDSMVMAAIPGMTVITPCDAVETRLAIKAVMDWNGPCYIRIHRTGEPIVHTTEPKFEIGKAIVIKRGEDMNLVATGYIINNVMKAAEMLEREGYSVGVVSMHTTKPIDKDYTNSDYNIRIEDQNLDAKYLHTVGTEDYLLDKANLSPEGIYRMVKKRIA